MKQYLAALLCVLLAVSLFAGCGKSPEAPVSSEPPASPAQTAAPAPTPEPTVTIDSGFWVVSKMTLDGSEYEGDFLTDIFGPADHTLSCGFAADGTVTCVYFDELFKSSWSGSSESATFTFGDQEAKAAVTDEGLLTVTVADGSVFTLVNQEEMPDAILNNPWRTYAPNFSEQETTAMSTFMAGGGYIVKDDVLYGLSHSVTLNGSLGATAFTMKGDFPSFGEVTDLDASGIANYLCIEGDHLYYVRDYSAICRVPLAGGDVEVLYDGACDYLQIYHGRLYFTDADYHFVSTDMDGNNLTTVVDRELYYPYFICENWIVFQDDADDESLHLYNIAHDADVNITYVPSYQPILDGSYLYFVMYDGDGIPYLNRIDMSDPAVFPCESSDLPLADTNYMIDGEYIYLPNNISRVKEEWQKLTDTGTAISSVNVYISPEYNIHHEFDADGLISAKYLTSIEKGGGTSFK